MIAFGLTRRPDLESSYEVRAFGFAEQSADDAAQTLESQLMPWLTELAAEHPFRFVVLDLRNVTLDHPAVVQALGKTTKEIEQHGWRPLWVVDRPLSAASAPVNSNGMPECARSNDELYSIFVREGLKRRPNSLTPLFTITPEELEEWRAHPNSIEDLIRELEAM